MCWPKRVWDSTQCIASTSSTVIATGTGTPSSLALPSQNKAGLLTGTVVPFAARKPAPRATPYMPSVPMKAGTRRREIRVPLISPGTMAAR